MKTLTLKNGSTEVEGLVVVTLHALTTLTQEDPIALYELWEKCKDHKHTMWADTAEELKKRNLTQPDGSVHGSIRNIVLSAITVEGLDIHLDSPLA